MNKIIITGNLGRDPEMRYTPNGQAVTEFSVAVRGYRKEDGPTWFNVTCWAELAERMAENLRKGSKVLVEGEMRMSSWEKDGEKRYRWFVNARNVEYLDKKDGSRQDDDHPFDGEPSASRAPTSASNDFDDLPF